MIGRESAGIANNWKGNIYEILIFDRKLSWTQQQNVEWYLGQKWEVSGTYLPGTLAMGNRSLHGGKGYVQTKMNLRTATDSEVLRALRGTTNGTVNQFAPDFTIKPSGNPEKINEFSIDTKREGRFVVPQ